VRKICDDEEIDVRREKRKGFYVGGYVVSVVDGKY
jgi:hypothetical protein